MTGAIILWSHALGALAFGALAALVLREPAKRPLAAATAMTAAAGVVLAALGTRDAGTLVAEWLRDACWIAALLALIGRHRAGHPALLAMAGSVVAVALLATAVGVVETVPAFDRAEPALFAVARALRCVAFAGGLVLARHAASVARREGEPQAGGVVAALAVLWTGEFAATAAAWALGQWPEPLVAFRGGTLVAAAVVAGAALLHRRETGIAPSRQIAWTLIAGVAVLAYGAAVAQAGGYAEALGPRARIVQVAVVVGAGAVLMTLIATPWLRAWARVMLAKHLFGHRYDYRREWQRFTAALAGDAPLAERVVRAIAGFTDSPGGLLLVAAEGRLLPEAAWRWAAPGAEADAALGDRMAGGWVVELDRLRGEDGGAEVAAERAAVPAEWLVAPDAWAAVPLVHDGQLVAAVLLARPPVTRGLDWEDFDLLRLAGRQAASHLAEDRARAALVEARRFDEFNRRFAFILHDLKNLVSQMTLTASNARRHADNPAFRADMVASLGDCADRMNALLTRLQSHGEQPAEALVPTDAAGVARRVAGRFAPRAVSVGGDASWVAAHPARLEQVIGHLVQNAVEASGEDAPVTVTVRAATEAADAVAIEVADRGSGMAPAFVRDELFRPFASSKPGGFGLGAFEARALVRAMGGSLAVDSRVGEGTRFRVTLPSAAVSDTAMRSTMEVAA